VTEQVDGSTVTGGSDFEEPPSWDHTMYEVSPGYRSV
jgi:hypothetical protein